MSQEHERIVNALAKIRGVMNIQVTPYGEISWQTELNGMAWLAKSWNDFCRCLGSMSEQGQIALK